MAAKPDSDPVQKPGSNTPDKGKRKTPEMDMDWLPKGWTFEDRVRTSGVTAGSSDRYYFDPTSGRKFRSKKEILYFLETGTPRKKGKTDTPGPEATPKAKSGAEKKKPATEKQKSAAEKPKPTAEKQKSAAEKVKPTAEIPKPATEKPKPAADKPKPAAEKPKPAAGKPKPAAEKQKLGEKKDHKANFNFAKVPEKVQWVFSVDSNSRESWNAFMGGNQVPESSKLDWLAAFTMLASKDRDKYH